MRSQQGGSPGRRERARFYACTTHFSRGAAVCGNSLRVRMETVDEAVVERLREILTPGLADDVIVAVRQLLKPHHADSRAALDADLAGLDRQIANLTDAVAMGGDLPALIGRLQQLEGVRQRLLHQRDELPALSPFTRIDWRLIEHQAREKLASWRALATRHVTEGRKLLGARL